VDAPPVRRGLSLPALWAFVAVFLPVVVALRAGLSTIDLAYQLRAGNFILHTHHLVRTDTYTFTAFGRPWLDQQWGAQVLLALVYRAGGWRWLALFRAAVIGAVFFFLYRACRDAGAHPRWAALLTIGSFVVTSAGLALRPQLFGILLFAATVWLVFGRRRHRGRLWAIPVLVVAWANLHGSFFLAPVLLGLAWLQDLDERAPGARRTLLVAVVSVLAASLNPFGLRVWSYAVGISTNPQITKFVEEWQPPTVRDPAGALFFGSMAAVVVIVVLAKQRIRWPALLSLGLFFAIGLFAIRGIFWWAMVAPVILAWLLFADRPAVVGPDDSPRAINALIAGGLVVLAVAFLPWWRTVAPPTGTGLLADAPTALTDALVRSVPPGTRVFNAQRWGSWMEFVGPRYPVTVDARIEVTSAQVWRLYSKVSIGQQGWQSILNRWGVRCVLAARDQQRDLLPFIRRDPGWRLVSSDAAGMLFVRR
jgi:hypothetical protein